MIGLLFNLDPHDWLLQDCSTSEEGMLRFDSEGLSGCMAEELSQDSQITTILVPAVPVLTRVDSAVLGPGDLDTSERMAQRMAHVFTSCGRCI